MKVVIAFDRDSKRIGKTVEVPDAEARVLIAEGRARPADGAAELPSSEPTQRPPLPEVVPPSEEVPVAAAAKTGRKKAAAAEGGAAK